MTEREVETELHINYLRKEKNYQCREIAPPAVLDVCKTADILDLSEDEFLQGMMEYQVFLQQFTNIAEATQLNDREIMERALTLYTLCREAEKQGLRLQINNQDVKL